MPDTSNVLEVDRQGPVFRIVMQRIPQRNALNTTLYNDLMVSLRTADADRNIRVVLLMAVGEMFTKGRRFDERLAFFEFETGYTAF